VGEQEKGEQEKGQEGANGVEMPSLFITSMLVSLKVMGEKLSKIIATVAHAKKKLALLNRVKEGGECHQKEEELIMDIRMALYKIAKVAQQVTDDTLDAIRTAESALMKL